MPNPIEDLRKRGVVDLNLPTMENYYTGKPGVNNFKRPTVLKNDGVARYNRKYMPDSQPGLQSVRAVTRLPAGFGEYANGLAILYMTAEASGITTHATGNVGAGLITGDWPNVLTGRMRCAVHKPVEKESDWATGWVPVDGINVPLVNITGSLDYYSLPSSWNTAVIGSYDNSIPSRQSFVTQRTGDFVLAYVSNTNRDAYNAPYIVDYTFKINPDLSVDTIVVDSAAANTFTDYHTHNLLASANVVTVDETKERRFWVCTSVTSSSIQGFMSPFSNYTGTQAFLNGGFRFQLLAVTGLSIRGARFLHSDDGAPPELWILTSDSNATYHVYRSTWKAGVTTKSTSNPRGYSFDPNWHTAANKVVSFPVEASTGVLLFRVERDAALPDVLYMFVDEGPGANYANDFATALRFAISTDNGKTWKFQSQSVTITGRNQELAVRDGIYATGWTVRPVSATDNTALNMAVTASGVAVFAGGDFWAYYKSDGTRIPFWNQSPHDAGVHLAFFYPFGPGNLVAALEDSKDVKFKPARVVRA